MADDFDPSHVVMRKAKDQCSRFKLDCGLSDALSETDSKKKVKWSDSTELREKMKEYRRSQLSICLDYQHIAIEEEREREGVRKWREIKDKLQNPDEEDDETIAAIKEASRLKEAPSDNGEGKDDKDGDEDGDDDDDDGVDEMSDSDDDPYCDEALETKLRVIKAKSSRCTLLPAYIAGVSAYESWMATDQHSALPEQKQADMTSQLDIYRQIVDLYDEWGDPDDVTKIDESYQAVLGKVTQARKLGDPPQVVTEAVNSVLTDDVNISRHKEVYSRLVNSMVTDLSKQIQTTRL